MNNEHSAQPSRPFISAGRGRRGPRIAWPGPALLIMAAMVGAPEEVHGQTGNFCVRDFQPGAVCTANDVRIQALNLVSLIESCDAGVVGQATGLFEAFVSSVGAPDRYDIGLFVALDGGSARDGDACFHDYLQPPLTTTPTYGDQNGDGVPDIAGGPWLTSDADACGDIAAGTQLFKVLAPLRMECVDTNGNGIVDASACTSWDNNAVTNCTGLPDAFPGTNAKCGCHRLETGIPMGMGPSPSPSPGPSPSPSSSPRPSPTPSPVPALPLRMLIALVALLAGGGSLLLRRRRTGPR